MTDKARIEAAVAALDSAVRAFAVIVRERGSELICEVRENGPRFGFPLLDGDYGTLRPTEVADFLLDPIPFHCDAHGVSREQYLAWVASGEENGFNTVRCAALTAKGERCRNHAGVASSPRDWVERDGALCVVHAGIGRGCE
jgi:hypothetical protein